MKKFAVLLSGCGVYDGAEIHEATLTLVAIKRFGADYQVFAPDIMQHHVINHLTGEEMPEKRNVLVESARIARGDAKPLTEYNPADYDALVIPGGFGAAKNLSSFAFEGDEMNVNNLVAEKIKATAAAGKPIGALCIAPVIVAKVLEGSKLTIGSDEGTAQAVDKLGGKHINAPSGAVVVDDENNIFSTPCYMLDGDIAQVASSCENIIKTMLEKM